MRLIQVIIWNSGADVRINAFNWSMLALMSSGRESHSPYSLDGIKFPVTTTSLTSGRIVESCLLGGAQVDSSFGKGKEAILGQSPLSIPVRVVSTSMKLSNVGSSQSRSILPFEMNGRIATSGS